ncbi:basic amino acid ABC transporter substrate-binding protein [Peribacillus sp. B-H-3]|uniref:basic amino acid ABC transporter substrate-binding protein n=1 Tax=Peribacillus sp. B-H-3 TaxID=3400420 RepID=UPI003B02A1DB
MKKLITALLVISSLIFLAAGCGSSDVSGDGKDAKGKTLRVVTDAAYSPFEYLDKDKIVGFDVDLIQAVAKEAGYKVKVENVGWDPLFVEIDSKRADIGLSAITINSDREQTYDFSNPYFLSTNKILVPEKSTIKNALDLKGKKVAVQSGTTGAEATEKLLGKNNKDIKKFENNNLAIMELNSGGAAAVVADNAVIEAYAKNNPGKNLAVIEDSSNFSKEFYGMMFPKGSKLKPEFDKALNKVFENGKYKEIYKKWLGSEPDMETLKAQQKK